MLATSQWLFEQKFGPEWSKVLSNKDVPVLLWLSQCTPPGSFTEYCLVECAQLASKTFVKIHKNADALFA